MAIEKTERLAVLIDADNTQATIIEGLLAEVAKYGTSSVKRIYGDWSSDVCSSDLQPDVPFFLLP